MKYVQFGQTGLKVSQFCLGIWHLPGSGTSDASGIEKVDAAAFRSIVKKAQDLGINFVDGANRYHGRMSTADYAHVGNSEKLFGAILKDYDRESWVVATKVRGPMAPWPNGEGLSRKHILWQVRESLGRLDIDYIDLYQIHWEDNSTPKLETLGALNDLVHRGLVHYLGESNHSATNVTEFMDLARGHSLEGFVSMQEPYNLLERRVERETLPVAKKYAMAVMAYVPLAQGVLSGKYLEGVKRGTRASYTAEVAGQYLNKDTSTAVESLLVLAKEKGVSLPQLALAWMLHKQADLGVTIIPILGITKPAYLDDNVNSLDIKLGRDDINRLEEIAATARLGPQSY